MTMTNANRRNARFENRKGRFRLYLAPWLLLALCLALGTVDPLPAAETNLPTAKPDSQTLILQMRLKRYTKELELTADQQTKIRTLLDEETLRLNQLRAQSELSFTDRSVKFKEVQQQTYAKIKPLLTEAQLPKWETMMRQLNPPPKKR